MAARRPGGKDERGNRQHNGNGNADTKELGQAGTTAGADLGAPAFGARTP